MAKLFRDQSRLVQRSSSSKVCIYICNYKATSTLCHQVYVRRNIPIKHVHTDSLVYIWVSKLNTYIYILNYIRKLAS